MLREGDAHVRPCAWDGVTLPYVPATPVVLGWYVPHDPSRMRVVVPDVEGKYWTLAKGIRYVERQIMPVTVGDCSVTEAPTKTAKTQVGWYDLPPPSRDWIARFLPPADAAAAAREGDG